MNNVLSSYARNQLKTDIAKCTEEEQDLFKRMYALPTNLLSCDKLKLSTDSIIDKMSDDELDWVMQQVERTLEK